MRPRKYITGMTALGIWGTDWHIPAERDRFQIAGVDFERILRRAYAECSEAHVYDGSKNLDEFALVRLLREFQALAPENEVAKHIERRVFRLRTKVDLVRPGPADAPEWAVWQRKLLKDYADIVHWWIDNRLCTIGPFTV